MRSKLLLFLGLICTQLSFAQSLSHYTYDTLTEPGYPNKTIFYKDHVYVVGLSLDHENPEFILRKLDTIGNMVWATVLESPGTGFSTYLNCFQFSVYENQYLLMGIYDSNRYVVTIYKVDLSNGNITAKAQKENSSSAAFTPFGFAVKDTAAFMSETYSDLILNTYNPKSAKMLSSFNLGPKDQNPYYLVGDNKGSLYYSKGDTIFKIHYTNPLLKIWKLPFTQKDKVTISKLHIDSNDGMLYAIGQAYPGVHAIPLVAKIDPSEGKILWNTQLPNISQYRYRQSEANAKSIYISWESQDTGGSAYYSPLSKIDKQTGALIWSQLPRYDPNSPLSQQVTALTIGSDGVYLVGKAWGLTKLDSLNGNVIFSFHVNADNSASGQQGNSAGYGLFETERKLISIGQRPHRSYEGREVFLSLNKQTGEILAEKNYGGLKQFDAKTVQLLATSQDQFVALQEVGARSKVVFFDAQLNPLWEYLFPWQHKVLCAKILNDSVLAVVTSNFDLALFNYINKRLLRSFAFAHPDNRDYSSLTKPSITVYAPNILFITLYNEPRNLATFFRIILEDDLGGNTLKLAQSGTTFSDQFSGNEVLVPVTQDTIFFAHAYGIEKKIIKPDGSTNGPYLSIPTGFNQAVHLSRFEQNYLLFTGYTRSEQIVITKIDPQNFLAVWTDTLPVLGKTSNWILGENPGVVYVIVNQSNKSLSLIKYDTEKQALIWQKTLLETLTENLFFTDILLDTDNQSLLISGYSESALNDSKALFINIGFDGTLQSNLIFKGDFVGKNQSLSVLHLKSANRTYLGGSITKNPQKASSAFIYSFEDKELNKGIKGLVYWDKNADGKQDKDEPNVSIGDVFLGFTTRIYLNPDGQFSAFPTSDQVTIRYRVPENWTLTTREFSYTIKTSDLNHQRDTFRFGIRPLMQVNKMNVYATGQQFICNEESPVYVVVKNVGTSTQNAKLRLDYQGVPILQSIIPDSINPRSMYWSFDGLTPGASRWVKLSFLIPGVDQIGDSLFFKSSAFYQSTANGVDSTQFNYFDLVFCSYDPNDKLVRTEGLQKNKLTLFNQYLYYTIRFQNTGNFPAKNIVLVDTLDADLDLNSFEFLHFSHPVTEVTIKDRVVKFVFNNINLPDSTNNEPESHGFVSFRIKDRSGLAEKTEIKNTAYIYFDKNPAIVTNTTQNIMVSKFDDIATSTSDRRSLAPMLKIYPNPAQDYFLVDIANLELQGKQWQMFNAVGAICLQGKIGQTPQKVSTQNLPSGLYYLQVYGAGIVKVLIVR